MSFVSVRMLARLAGAAALVAAAGTAAAQSDVNVYTYRETKLIQPLFDAFTKDTGIKVNVISASSGLEQRIKTEGANSPADVLLTVDIGRLEDAVQAGITQSSRARSPMRNSPTRSGKARSASAPASTSTTMR
jgi:iron(III) transport system substrate-binding protein